MLLLGGVSVIQDSLKVQLVVRVEGKVDDIIGAGLEEWKGKVADGVVDESQAFWLSRRGETRDRELIDHDTDCTTSVRRWVRKVVGAAVEGVGGSGASVVDRSQAEALNCRAFMASTKDVVV